MMNILLDLYTHRVINTDRRTFSNLLS